MAALPRRTPTPHPTSMLPAGRSAGSGGIQRNRECVLTRMGLAQHLAICSPPARPNYSTTTGSGGRWTGCSTATGPA